jgi:hypothetical protein
MPKKDGWFWVLLMDYDHPIPCWYNVEGGYFLPGGLGDSSSAGIFEDEVDKVGPEIHQPTF